ncbi:MAG: hypothetical protein QNJ73_07390 [Gammaproteobacteria bacterium]|nr:hypothetical protein [Gammaproteobacteria bacterium]
MSAVLFGILGIAIAACGGTPAATDRYRTPVLLVHGHGMGSNSMSYIVSQLVADGYPPEFVHAVDIVPSTAGNVAAAEMFLMPAVSALLEKASQRREESGAVDTGPARVDIVAHSMGALSSRYFAVRLRPERVRTWISIAGANHGTEALCRFNDPGALEACPAFAADSRQSPIQLILNGSVTAKVDETPYGLGIDAEPELSVRPTETRSIAYFTLRIDPDEWIVPARSAELDGAGGFEIELSPGNAFRETSSGNFLFDDSGARAPDHDAMLAHPSVAEIILAILRAR